MILAIDTSTDQASVALTEETSVQAECSWIAGRNHSRQLTRVIRHVLVLRGAEVASISAVVVARGPGSFSGVRVGIAEAKGIAMALQVPLVGISTLDVLAFQASPCGLDLWAILPAGRNEVNLAHYVGGGADWRRVSDYLLLPVEEAARAVGGRAILTGPGAQLVADYVAQFGPRPTVQNAAGSLRRAGYLAELGRRYLEAGGRDQLDDLEPLYLRRSAAEEKRAATGQE
jgi:tRNA threonylcarbamoyladenosine biosynthesis protein TsaB